MLLYEYLTGNARRAQEKRQEQTERALAKLEEVAGPVVKRPKTERRLRGIVVKRTGKRLYDAGIDEPPPG